MGMAWLRSYNPDILGTEKPMELMFINSILRSTTFPPQDAWLAGYSISYYYFGYVMVAFISMLTSTPAGIAFNLAIAQMRADGYLEYLNTRWFFMYDASAPARVANVSRTAGGLVLSPMATRAQAVSRTLTDLSGSWRPGM